MKSLSVIILAFAAFIGVLCLLFAAGESEGLTYIYNVNDLQNMNNNLTENYELANDIDASATQTMDGGRGFLPVQ